QFITESLLLGLGRGALGVFLTYACIKLLPLTSLRTIPRVQDVQLDHSVLIFTLILSLLTSIVFGLIPALKSSGVDLHESIKEGTSPGQGGQVARRIQNILVVSEIALALVILTGAGLMVKSYLRILYTDPGLNPSNVLILETNLPFSKYPQDYQ